MTRHPRAPDERKKRPFILPLLLAAILGLVINAAVAVALSLFARTAAPVPHAATDDDEDLLRRRAYQPRFGRGFGRLRFTDEEAERARRYAWRLMRRSPHVLVEGPGTAATLIMDQPPLAPCALRLRAGWPMTSFAGDWVEGRPPRGIYWPRRPNSTAQIAARSLGPQSAAGWRSRPITVRPAWPGFAVNTMLYGLAGFGLVGTRSVRRAIRVRRGRCPLCGYPAGPSPVCSECGHRREPLEVLGAGGG